MKVLLTTCFLCLCGFAPPAAADQNDPRLDVLFAQLKSASDVGQTASLEGQIWGIWLENDSPTISLLMHRTLVSMNEGRLDDCLDVLDEMVELAPEFAEAWNKRATVLYLMDRYEESLADVFKTLELEPRHFGALSGMGLIYNALGNDAKALEAFERALEVNPHIPLAESEVKRLKKKVRGEKI